MEEKMEYSKLETLDETKKLLWAFQDSMEKQMEKAKSQFKQKEEEMNKFSFVVFEQMAPKIENIQQVAPPFEISFLL